MFRSCIYFMQAEAVKRKLKKNAPEVLNVHVNDNNKKI